MSLIKTINCYCEKIKELFDRVIVLENAPGSDNQTLTLVGDVLSISNGNNVTITHPTQTVTPEICTGEFVYTSPRRGRLGAVTTLTTNATVTALDWFEVGTWGTPSCVTDVQFDLDYGDAYSQTRRAGILQWYDVRFLINGVPVTTYVTDRYEYNETRSDTNPDVINPISLDFHAVGSSKYTRLNVPAGATVSAEIRIRIRRWGAQASAYTRWIGLYRTRMNIVAIPRNIVTNVTS